MYKGGVRVAILKNNKLLLVKQRHEGRDIWMLPGGGIEEGETSVEAAEREVFEETGLQVKVKDLLWFIEELREEKNAKNDVECVENKEQRFVIFYRAEFVSGKLGLGKDPEFDESNQVLSEVAFFSRDEIENDKIIENIYPNFIRDEMWCLLSNDNKYNPYKERKRK